VAADLPASDAALVALLVRNRGTYGMARAELEVAAGMDRARLTAATHSALAQGVVESDAWLVAAEEVAGLAERLKGALEGYHAKHPLEEGMPVQSWRASAGNVARALLDVAEQRLMSAGGVLRDSSQVRVAGWKPRLGDAAQPLRKELLEALSRAGAEPPSVGELQAQHPTADVPALLRMLAREGLVVGVGKERYYEAAALRGERDRIVTALADLGAATPAELRTRLGRSRKWLIPFLEWCDTQGITLRKGDTRVLGSGASA
jgi:selenocysteine-specific elongation factor